MHFAGITVRLCSLKDSCISHCIDPTRTTRTQRNLLGDIRSPPRFPRTGPAPFQHEAGQSLRSVQSSGVHSGSGRCKLRSLPITPHRVHYNSRFRRDSSAHRPPPPLTKRDGDGGFFLQLWRPALIGTVAASGALRRDIPLRNLPACAACQPPSAASRAALLYAQRIR